MAKILEIGNVSFLYELNTSKCGHGSEEKSFAIVGLSHSSLLLPEFWEDFELRNLLSLCFWEISFSPIEHFLLSLSLVVKEALVVFGLSLLLDDGEQGSVAKYDKKIKWLNGFRTWYVKMWMKFLFCISYSLITF